MIYFFQLPRWNAIFSCDNGFCAEQRIRLNPYHGDGYGCLDELAAPAPVQTRHGEEGTIYKHESLGEIRGSDPDLYALEHASPRDLDRPGDDEDGDDGSGEYKTVGSYTGLDELAAPSPVDNPREEQEYRPEFLECAAPESSFGGVAPKPNISGRDQSKIASEQQLRQQSRA